MGALAAARARRSLPFWFGLSLLIHLAAARFSEGFLHYDEHFQILEFMRYKLAGSPADLAAQLPWEFHERLRPWWQPALFGLLARCWGAAGVAEPAAWAEALRYFCGALGWLSGLCLFLAFRRGPGTEAAPAASASRRAAWGFCFLWFLPYLHVRISSESLSSSFFYLGLAALMLGRFTTRAHAWAGLLCGLAFECRFQSGFLIAGLGLWLLCVRRPGGKALAAAAAPLALVIALGVCLDRWGYGAWTFTPWNYLRSNLFENKAAQWGVLPWWGYFALAWKAYPPLSILVCAATLLAWARHPRHPLTWASIPFFAVHCAIGHKELRFLIPLAWAAPAFIALAWDRPARPLWRRLGLTLNGAGLLALTLLPARTEIAFYRALWLAFPHGLEYRTLQGQDPFELAHLQAEYYKPRPALRRDHATLEDLSAARADGGPWLFYHDGLDLPAPLAARCVTLVSNVPPWQRRWLPPALLRSQRVMTLERCQ